MNSSTPKSLLLLLLLCFFAPDRSSAQSSRPHAGTKNESNYTGFPDAPEVPAEVWKKVNTRAADYPDAASSYRDMPGGKRYIEVADRRKVNEKYFVDPEHTGEFILEKGYNALNFQKDGKWLTVDAHLKPAGNGVYEAPAQWEPVGIDANNQASYIRMNGGIFRFNQWKLYGAGAAGQELIAAADWSHYTAGADGIFIKNIFPGIDAEMRVLRGGIKTNFIVHKVMFPQYSKLYFCDNMEGLAGLHFPDKETKEAIGAVYGTLGKEESAVKINPAIVYEKNDPGGATTAPYMIAGNKLNVIITTEYLQQHVSKGGVVIDPQVTSTNSIAQSLVGTPYNASCTWTTACDYTINVVPPAAATITDVQDQVEVIATAPCGLENFGYQIVSGTCISPAAGVVWIANGATGPGTMWAGYFSEPNLVACMPAASCSPTGVDFTFHLYRTCVGPTTPACDNTCLGLNNPLSVRIVGYTAQYASITPYPADTTCYGNTLGIKAVPQYGKTPYSATNWSFSSTGTPSVGTGDSISLGVLAPGTYTVYANATDACGTVMQTSKVVKVYPIPAVTIATRNNPSTCSGADGSVTLYGLTASTSYTVNYTKNGTGATPVVISSDASGALAISGLTAGTYTAFQLTAHGCPGAVSVLSVTLADPAASTETVTGNPCTANVITMTANPSWAINTWQYNGSPVITDTIRSWNATGTVAAGGNGTGTALNQFATGPLGMAIDVSGNVYVADNNNHRVMKWQPGAATGILVAGGNGAGSGLNQFNAPYGVYADADSNVYVLDRNNHRVVKWAPGATTGVVVAGGNGAGAGANQVNNPRSVFVDGAKNVYVADFNNNRIMKWAPGATAGTVVAGGNGAGAAANQLNQPVHIHVDASGNIYIADFANNRIQKWAPGATTGTTVAGGNGAGSGTNQFNGPRSVRVDQLGFLYVADQNNNRIQKWTPGAASGVTIAGGNGVGAALNQTNSPVDMAIDANGAVYVLEQNNVRVTKFTPKATDTLVPGASGTYTANITSFNGCTNTANINWVQKDTVTITANPGSINCVGTSVTFTATVLHAGTSPVYTWKKNGVTVSTGGATYTTSALNNKDVISCTFSSSNPCAVSDSIIMTVNPLPAVTLTGNPCTANVITMNSNPVWSVDAWQYNAAPLVNDTNTWNSFATLAAGVTASAGSAANQLNFPLGVFADAAGNVYVADRGNNRVQKWAPGATTGTTVAGGNGAGNAANQLNAPFAIFVDADTNVYVMDWGNARVQKWAYGATTGTTVAGGNGGGSALNQLNASQGLFVDGNKNVYVADNSNNRVVKWAPGATSGILAAGGNGSGSGLNQFNNPVSVYVDGANNLYVSDYNNHRVVKWTPGAASGTVVAGGNGAGSAANQLNGSRVSWLDGAGNIYVCDQNNSRIQRWRPGATSGTTVVGGNGAGNALNQLNSPTSVYISQNGDIYTVEQGNHRALKFSPRLTDSIIPALSGTYTATVASFNGCSNTATINWTIPDTISLSANPGYEVCAGTSVTFTATVLHPGTSPVYTWKKNGTPVGGNSATYTTAGLANNDRVTCTFSSSNPCTISDSVVMIVNPMPNAAISGTPCTGKTLTLNPGVTSLKTQWLYNGSAFQTYDAAWQPNGTVVAGGNGGGNALNQLNNPCTVFVDGAGNIIIADNSNQRIMKWAPGATTGTIVAGGNGLGSALNQFIWGNSVMPGYNTNEMYISDANNARLVKWIQGGAAGVVIAGNNGTGTAANQVRPYNAALDGYSNLFMPDANSTSPRVQKWKIGYSTGTTVAAGNGAGSAANQLNNPYSIVLDNNAADIYITDYVANRVQKWTVGAASGTTVAGDNGAGAGANQLNSPYGIQLDGLKNLYVSDGGNNRIQRWAPGATSGTTIIGGNGAGAGLNQLNSPDGIFMDGNGNMYIPENNNNRVTRFQAYNTDTIVAPNAGTYKVILTTFKGCKDSATYVVNQTPIVTAKIAVDPTTCAGTNGSVTLNGLTNSTAFTVTYKKNGVTVGPLSLSSNGSGSIVISGLSAAVYSNFSVTAPSSGCISAADTTSLTLVDPNPPAAPSVSSNTPVCEGQTLNLNTPAVSGVTYNWTGPNSFSSSNQNPSIATVTAAAAGTYSLTTTNTTTGCTSAAGTTAVVIKPLPIVPTAGSNSPICTGQTLNLTASTATGGATYSWTGPNSFATTTQNPSITAATTAAAGTYSVVSILNGCQSATTATVNVSVNVTPVVSSSSSASPATCNGTGSITLNGMVASTTYTINYTKNGTPVTPVNITSTSGGVIVIPNLTAGTYASVTVGAGSGCTSTPAGPFTLTDPPTPATPTAGSNTPVCEGQPLNLTASTATGAYSWTGPNSFTSAAQNPVINPVTAAAAGTYSVTITNTTTNCTSLAATTTVVVKPLPVVPTAGSNSPVCTGQTLNLTAGTPTSSATYSWTGPNSFATTTQNPSITAVTTAAAGTYSVVSILNGCQSATTATVNVSVNVTPVVSSSSSASPTTCNGSNGTITLNGMDATTTYTINYTKNGTPATPVNITSSLGGTVTIANLSSGTYTNVTVGAGSGCTSAPAGPFTLTDPPIPAAPTAGSNTPVCEGQSLNLTASTVSGVSYSWTGPNSFTSSGQNPVINPVTAAAAGTYSVTITNTSTNCTSPAATTTVVIKPLPVAPVAGSNSPVCVNQAINLTASTTTSGATYTWTGPNSFATTTQNPTIASATAANTGTYIVYSLLNGCQSATSGAVNVVVKPLPNVPTVSSNSPVCSGTGNTLNLTSSSTTPAVTYGWTGPNSFTSSTQNPSIATPTTAASGTYTVTVTLSGCTSSATTNVVVNQTPAAPGVTNISYCQFETPAALTATGTNLKWYTAASGGTALGGAPVPSTLVATTLTWYVSQTDGVNGCESQRSAISVTIKPKPATPTGTASYSYCQFEQVPALTATGINQLWYTTATGGSGGNIAPVPATAVPGTYYWWVSQTVNGCESDRFMITIVVKPKPAPPVVSSPVIYCQNDAAVPLTAIGSNLKWYTSPTGGGGASLAPTPYTGYEDTLTWWVTQTINGCESDRSKLDVYIYYKPNGIVVASKTYVCQYDTISFSYFGNALPAAQYDWKVPFKAGTILSGSGQGPIVVRFDSAGDYNVRMQVNNHGCVSSEAFQLVHVRPVPVVRLGLKDDACQDEVVTVSLSYSSMPVDQYAWSWDGGTVLYGSFDGGPYGVQWHTPGKHVVSLVATSNSCKAKPYNDTINIHALPDARILNTSSTEICTGDSVLLRSTLADSGYTYLWSPQPYFGEYATAGPDVWAVVSHTGYIHFEMGSTWGCKASDSVLITTKPCCEVYFPNAFTPNGDGRNDVFRVVTRGHHKISNFRVMNRWGQTIFETADENRGWDGTFGGAEQPIGTYYYYIRYQCEVGQYLEQKGEITLLR